MIDFKTAYGDVYRDIWEIHKKYHNRDYVNPDRFWQELVDEISAYCKASNNSAFIVEMLVAILQEIERVTHKGLPPNSSREQSSIET